MSSSRSLITVGEKDPGDVAPVFSDARSTGLAVSDLRTQLDNLKETWLKSKRSKATRENYDRWLRQFFVFHKVDPKRLEWLLHVRPNHIAEWMDSLLDEGPDQQTNSSVACKISGVSSLFSYMKTYGYMGANPASSKFVSKPKVPKDGLTPALTSEDCRKLLDSPDTETPVGLRDSAIWSVFAFGALRVGELVKLKVKHYGQDGVHRVLNVYGKGGKHRKIAVNAEAAEKVEAFLQTCGYSDDPKAPLFQAPATARGKGRDGWRGKPMSTRAVQLLFDRYKLELGIPESCTVHSLRVTAPTEARKQGFDILDLKTWLGHSTAEVTQRYIRAQENLPRQQNLWVKSGSGSFPSWW